MTAAAVPVPGRSKREGRITRWLRTAPAAVFALYGGLAAFCAYSAMYAFRKPFAAADYAHVAGWSFGVDFKVALVIAQVAGYALSKIIGVKVVSELRPERRPAAILVLIAGAEVALVLFAVSSPWAALAALFANGLCLGMIWGLVFGFLEGRRLSEVLGAMLCASFILASGVVKSVGKGLLLSGAASEGWMPAATGLIFTPLLLVSVWALAQLPPPDAADEAARVRRAPMTARDRARLFNAYAPGLLALLAVYVLLTAIRDLRDNFAAEIWSALGFSGEAGVFTWSELPVAVIVLSGLAFLTRIRDNGRAVAWNIAFVGGGLAVLGLSTLAWQAGLLGPIAWMIATGAGLYMAYTPFNALLFDRFIAATSSVGTAGFLIYLADSSGYVGSVALLLTKTFANLNLRWDSFLALSAYVTSLVGLTATGLAYLYFRRRHFVGGDHAPTLILGDKS